MTAILFPITLITQGLLESDFWVLVKASKPVENAWQWGIGGEDYLGGWWFFEGIPSLALNVCSMTCWFPSISIPKGNSFSGTLPPRGDWQQLLQPCPGSYFKAKAEKLPKTELSPPPSTAVPYLSLVPSNLQTPTGIWKANYPEGHFRIVVFETKWGRGGGWVSSLLYESDKIRDTCSSGR